MSNKSVALLVDYENIAISLNKKKKALKLSELNLLREEITKYGELKINRIIANWSNFHQDKSQFGTFGFTIMEAFTTCENASDILLTVEGMKMFYEDSIDVFVIFAGDGDFLPLVNHLVDKGKEVYLYSVKDSTNQNLIGRLGETKHLWIEEAIPAFIENSVGLTELQGKIVKGIYDGLKRYSGVYGRNGFLNYVVQGPHIYGPLTKDEAGILVDTLITLNVIIPDEVQAPKYMRTLKINYDHPLVITLPFISERH